MDANEKGVSSFIDEFGRGRLAGIESGEQEERSPLESKRKKEILSLIYKGGKGALYGLTGQRYDTEKDDSYLNYTLETLEDVCKERDRLRGENLRLYEEVKEMNEIQGKVVIEQRINELVTEIERLKQENNDLYKKYKTVRSKADERKTTLKQLFDLVMEKDKELNAYKEALKGKGESVQRRKEDFGKIIDQKAMELGLKYGFLEKKLNEKEVQLKRIEEVLRSFHNRNEKESKVFSHNDRRGKSQSSSKVKILFILELINVRNTPKEKIQE